MLLLLLAACDTPDPYAGCTVYAAGIPPSGEAEARYQWVYDEEARLVWERYESDGGFESSTVRTWEGSCPVGVAITETWWGEERRNVRTTTCDAHDDPVRVDIEEVTRVDGVVLETSSQAYTYANAHDDEGRLVRMTLAVDGAFSEEAAYTWGACDQPVLTRRTFYDGSWGASQVECREDGQPSEESRAWYDAENALYLVVRTTRTYDDAGRRRTVRVETDGEESYTDTSEWADPEAPGPTRVTRTDGGVLQYVFAYAYDCPP